MAENTDQKNSEYGHFSYTMYNEAFLRKQLTAKSYMFEDVLNTLCFPDKKYIL